MNPRADSSTDSCPGSNSRAETFSGRLVTLAGDDPGRVAVRLVSRAGAVTEFTRSDLARRAAGIAALLEERGVAAGTLLVVALPTSIEHLAVSLAAWQLGACVLPINPGMPDPERHATLALARSWKPAVGIGDVDFGDLTAIGAADLRDIEAEPIAPDRHVVPEPGKAIGSGGSTGRPKIIVDPKPWVHVPGRWGVINRLGLAPEQTSLIFGRMYHNMGFYLSHLALFEGHTIILPEKFDAAQTVDLIERYRVQFIAPLPIMMQRIAKLDGIEERDFSSIEGMYHSGGACPPWVKHLWLRLVPPERQWELYGSSEEKGATAIRGDEWLERPGSVGRAFETEIRIMGSDGAEKPAGEIGEIFMRNRVDPAVPLGGTWPQEPTLEYVGAPPPPELEGGYVSVGDMGYLDDDGYLYLADRRVDMIKSGGVNIYPAEIEGVLSEFDGVEDVVVVGIPDAEWGHRVHAIVQPRDAGNPPGEQALDRFCRERLAGYKAPKSFEFLETLPRDPSGKIRRTALREERRAGVPGAAEPAA